MIQIAFSLALLTAGALFIHGASKAASVDTGLRPGASVLLETDASLAGVGRVGAQQRYEQLRERLAAMPGVERVAISATVPFGIVSLSRSVHRAGAKPAAGYAADDAPRAEGGGGAGGFGYSDDGSGNPGEMMQVVGVVPAARRGLSDKEPAGQIYVPFAHGYQSDIFYFVRFRPRTRGTDAGAADMIRRTISSVDPTLPVLSLQTFDEHLAGSLQVWFARAAAGLFSAFGGLAVGLAVVGLYGVRAYTVARRTREIGIRMALGAQRHDILRMFGRESSLTIGGGLALGLLLAAALGTGLSELLYETGPLDPVAFTTASLLSGAAMLIATWLSARRATRIAPMVALRTE